MVSWYIHSCFKIVIEPHLGDMDIDSYLSNLQEFSRVSEGFSRRSNGLSGAIGEIDGWLVKII